MSLNSIFGNGAFSSLHACLILSKPVPNFSPKWIFANKSAAEIFKTYYDEIIEDCIKQIAPSFPEGFLRYMIVNKNSCDVFRFNFPCTTKSCFERDGFLIHANAPQYNIYKNNIPIPIAKYPKFESKEWNNPVFDLPLIKNPIM